MKILSTAYIKSDIIERNSDQVKSDTDDKPALGKAEYVM